MTNPKYAVATDKGRYYSVPGTGEMFPSVTNVLDTCVHKPALVPWAAKVTAAKAWDELPRMVYTARRPKEREALNREIKQQAKIIRDTAADLGTRIHDWSEAHVLGTPTPEDPEVVPYAVQVIDFFDRWGVVFDRDVEATECTIINRTIGYAGTLDLLVWLRLNPDTRKWDPSGLWRWLIDYKSSSTKPADVSYDEHELQLAALRGGETALLADGTEEPIPGPIDGCAILSLRPKEWALLPRNCGPEALAAFAHLVPAARYLHDMDHKPLPVAPPPRWAAEGRAA